MGSNISQADLNFLRDWIRNFYNYFEHCKWNIIVKVITNLMKYN